MLWKIQEAVKVSYSENHQTSKFNKPYPRNFFLEIDYDQPLSKGQLLISGHLLIQL